MTYDIAIDDRQYRVELVRKDGHWHCAVNGREVPVDPVLLRADLLSLIVDGVSHEVKREIAGAETHLWVGSERYGAQLCDPRSLRNRRAAAGAAEGAKKVLASMPGKVVRVLVKEHDAVLAGQGVVVVEAMKMQNELKSPKPGTVQKVLVTQGASVNAGDVLFVIE